MALISDIVLNNWIKDLLYLLFDYEKSGLDYDVFSTVQEEYHPKCLLYIDLIVIGLCIFFK